MQLTIEQLAPSLSAIHATAPMVVLEFAGAGAQALAWLHGVGGSSRTLLEATDRYAAASLAEAIGFEPDRATSPRVARAMASRAYNRARELAAPGTPVAGIGCTATIATDRTKRGDHRCCLAVCEAQGVNSWTLKLTKGQRTRQEEEHLVSLLILRAIAGVCGVAGLPEPALLAEERVMTDFELSEPLSWLMAEEVDWAAQFPDGEITVGQTWPQIALLSGAFNPLHEGHRQMAQAAAGMLGQSVYFELPLVNADKAPLGLAEARRRAAQFIDFAPLLFTRAPLFNMKAALFPHSVFILGVDTVERLVQLRFYNHDPAELEAAFNQLKAAGCRFLVVGRLRGETFLTLKDIPLPEAYRDLFEEIPAELFRVDISSTAIRESK